MKFISIAAMLLLLGTAHAQSSPSETKAARKRARMAKARNFTYAAAGKDWKGWLNKNFPDASASWPEQAAKAAEAVVGSGTWAYAGKGNIDRDGSPTLLLVKFRDAKTDDLIVSHLLVSKWLDGKWTEMLTLDAEDGLAVNGAKPGALQSPDFHGYTLRLFGGDADNPDHPGMWITVRAVDKNGETVTEPADFYFLPKEKIYGGDSN